ncbi:hypothetical protein PAXRUDRAFT_251536 [Paxillus rubicundulus Ve08.2h10]|uniref:Uncharacterized protein n=1 Tax=Paxillus rubicundulus Ve08.2h10 TaxID=930991 RepID=A0A0D0DNB5_9AGAM|nr:hypothetical protein PAXRUDRAFT_251536 [Paxillus rubicundulus Ve08.2h10]
MAKTKQTAKKTTGGTALRVSIRVRTSTLGTTNTSAHQPAHLDATVLYPTSKVDDSETAGPTTNQNDPDAIMSRPPSPASLPLWLGRQMLQASLSAPRRHSGQTNDDYCHLCGNGGDLYTCDACPRSSCRQCVVIPPEHVNLVAAEDVTFLCISCHLLDDNTEGSSAPYQVSTILYSQRFTH